MLIALIVVLAVALVALGARSRRHRQRAPARTSPPAARRILFPFVASALSRRALDAALRLSRAEEATLVPVFLARVPLHLPLDAPLPRQSGVALSLQEAIEQRAAAFGVPVDARIERGRTNRHALRQTIATERFDRIVIAAAADAATASTPTTWPGCSPTRPARSSSCARATVDELEPPRARLRPRGRPRNGRGRAGRTGMR